MNKEVNELDLSESELPKIDRPVVVGIGASAGGLEAISRLLKGIPGDSGMSFVIIQHLDPIHKSALVEILSRRTDLPIREVQEDTKVEPNHIYVIPPGQYLSIEGCVLKLSEPQAPRGSRMAIDYFLTSLAEDACEFGIGVVLSGTGSDGTAGLQEIKHYGGLTVVQDPEEAEHAGMPQNAIDAVHVDYVLSAEKIGSQLKRYVDFCQTHGPLSAQTVAQAEQSNLTPILDLMRKKIKHDFRRYRKNTLMRRIQRRMGLHQLDQLSDYQALLADSERERNALRCDLLIGVTRFFRNPEAWDVLEEKVVRPMLAPERTSPIRVWCAGCATGEEAYSIAMLLLEQVGTDRRKLPFQIFATDVADDALAFARTGLYPEAIMKDVPLERLRRFFKKEPGGYRVTKQLRESVVFANQNILAQPPFSKLDLILCRNLLIYLQREAQERVMNVFQFALKEGGVLFQGSSESVGKSADLYTTISKKHRVYRRNELKAWPPIGGKYEANVQPLPEFSAPERKTQRNIHHVDGITAVAQRHLLQQLGHGVIIVNGQNRLLYAEGKADAYIQSGMGEMTPELPDVMEIARKGLKAKLRSSLRKIWNGQSSLKVEARVQRDGSFHPCELQISKLPGRPDDDPAAMVIFTPIEPKARALAGGASESGSEAGQELRPNAGNNADAESKSIAAEQALMEVERELLTTRDQLNSSVSDIESANEELKAANEEAMSMNEELQSSNEELETSKEELQSLNEELTTLNNQLEIKVDELEDTTNDLENLLTSSDIPTVFLDTKFRIRRYTPSCEELFHFIAGDVGRPLQDIKAYFDDPDLLSDAKAVLRDLQPRERQVTSTAILSANRSTDSSEDDPDRPSGRATIRSGRGDESDSAGLVTSSTTDSVRRYRRRILPYRTEDNRIQGVVMTLTDVTDLLGALELAESDRRKLQTIADSIPPMIAFVDQGFHYQFVNARYAKQFERPAKEIVGRRIRDIVGKENFDDIQPHLQTALSGEQLTYELKLHVGDGDEVRFKEVTYVPESDAAGVVSGVYVVVVDVTDRRLAELELANREAHLRRVIDHQLGFAGVLERDGTVVEIGNAALAAAGLGRDDVLGKKFWECYWWNYDTVVAEQIEDAVRQASSGTVVRFDQLARTADDGRITVDFMVQPILDSEGNIKYLIPSGVDISDRHAVEIELRKKQLQNRMALHAGGMAAWEWTPETSRWEPELYDLLGISREVEASTEQFFKSVHEEDFPGLKEAWQQATEGEKEYYHEFRIRRSGGEVRWLVGTGSVTKDSQGGVERIYGLNWDITEQKHRELNLAFLADLQTAFNPLQSRDRLLRLTCRRTAEFLDLSHCCFVEVDSQATTADVVHDHPGGDAQSLVGQYAIEDYHTADERQTLLDGNAVVVNDTQRDVDNPEQRANFAALDIGAVCNVAFVSDGQIKFVVGAHKNRPHQWTTDEIQLLQDVTQRLCVRVERANAEQQLADAKARLDLSLEVANIAPWSWNMEANDVIPNPALNQMFGFDDEASPKVQDFIDRMAPDAQQRVSRAIEDAINQGETYDQEYPVHLPSGEVRHVRARGSVRKSADGEITEFVGVVVDITERKHQELELAGREAHLRRVINNQLGLVGVIDRDGNLVEVDDRSLEIANTSREDVIGKHFAKAPWWSYDPKVAGQMRDAMQRAFAGEVVRYDVSLFAHGDEGVMIDFMIAPVKNEAGEVEYLIPSGIDIRDRHATEQELRQSQAKLQVLFHQNTFHIGIVDLSGTLVDANDAAIVPFGLKRDDAIGKKMWDGPWFEGLSETQASLRAGFQQALNGENFQADVEFVAHGGIYRGHSSFSFTPARDNEGNVTFIIATGSDVTERIQRERHLKFMADLHAEFAPLDSSREIKRIGSERIAEHLGLNRCAITEYSADGKEANVIFEVSADGLLDSLGNFPTGESLTPDEFQQLSDGELVVIEDTLDDSRSETDRKRYEKLGIGSCVKAPFPAKRRLKFSMTACRSNACQWPESELNLIRELTSVLFLRVERARSSEQLANSRQQLAMAMESARMGSFWWEPETDNCDWDDQWYDAVGVAHDIEKTGKTFNNLIHPDDLDIAKEATRRAIEDGENYQVEFRVRSHDGKTRWIAGNGRVTTARNGRKRLVGLNWDITEQKAAMEQIRLGEQRLRTAAEAAGFGTLHADLSTGLTTLSPELLRVVGLPTDSPQTITSGETPDWVHPDDRQLCVDLFEKLKAQNTDQSKSTDHRIIRPDGEVRWVHLLGKPVFNGSGTRRKIRQVIGTLVDITERRQYEQSLEEARRAAEAANESKSAFLANMSHEIRTPMTAILGYTDLTTAIVDNQEALGHLRTIRRNGGFLLEIINDILDLSKIEADKLDVVPQRFDLAKLIEDVRSIMDVRASENDLELEVKYDTKIPVEIESDPKRLRQILVNLVGNAIKFTKVGAVKIKVAYDGRESRQEFRNTLAKEPKVLATFAAEEPTGLLRISIVDTGIGMSDDQQQRLFQPFSQGDHNVNREFGGTGLGLAISHRLATMLGGTIEVVSVQGKGSTFSATIDVGDIRDVELVNPSVTSTPNAPTAQSSDVQLDCHALVVDDRRDIRFLSRKVLTDAGATVSEAEDGAIAVEAVNQAMKEGTPPDIIMLDMQMPRMDGYETAKTLRKMGYDGPIIALTADAMQGDMNNCIQAGCNDYLSKPINKSVLLQKVSHYLKP